MDRNEVAARGAKARGRRIEALFAAEPDRLSRFTATVGSLHADLSKSQMSGEDLDALLTLARTSGLEATRARLFSGEAINLTEDRAVLHMALRDPARDWSAKGAPVSKLVAEALAAENAFAEAVRSGAIAAKDGAPFEAVLHLGIGGSDLGPRFVHEALSGAGGARELTLRFAANVEPGELAAALAGLDPARTLVICVSKTFTTLETLANLAAARAWLQGATGPDDSAHLAAVSAAPVKAVAAGFKADRIFGFEEWVGGRFSLWSAVGLSLRIALGPETVAALHAGAAAMDRHFETAPFARNLPVLFALLGWWNRTALDLPSRAIIPYARRLRLLPQFLQQLDMESNGKAVGVDGRPVATSCPVVWGAEGTNAQHAFFQHLHQSPDVTPVEFIALASDPYDAPARTRMTLANALAQAEALMRGKTRAAVAADMAAAGADPATIEALADHRVFPGDRPSSFLIMEALDAHALGALLALCEHRTFVEGHLWGVNSFDQWGVELGKVIAAQIDADLSNGPSPARDPSTAALIARLRGVLP
jgi:glucose-6-phosphate isomerase